MKKIILLLLILLLVPTLSHAYLAKGNWIYGTLGEAITSGYTTGEIIDITYGSNSKKLTGLSCSSTNPCRLIIYDASCSAPSSCANREIMDASVGTDTTFTIKTRNAEETCTSCSFAQNAKFAMVMTAANLSSELYTDTKCINIDPIATTTNWFMWKAPYAVTITGIDCIVDAATSVILTPTETDADGSSNPATIEAAITCDIDGATEASTIDNPTIEAGHWVKVTRGAVTGSPTQAVLCIEFTKGN